MPECDSVQALTFDGPMRRRTLTIASAAGLATVALPRASYARPNGEQVLRFVPHAPLTVLDPAYTPANITRTHALYVYDTLFACDSAFRPHPQMAAGYSVALDGRTWRIVLRDGLRFHDGTPVLAADCAASMRRWMAADTLGHLVASVVEEWRASDDKTLNVRLNRPFPFLLDAISSPTGHQPVIMPARHASLPPGRLTEAPIGSGPYRFAANEFVLGERATYLRFRQYIPRDEPHDWNSGSKKVHFDRVEWHALTDPSTAAAALRNGEVDWWEAALADLLPQLRADQDLRLEPADPIGHMAILRFNTLHPPFDNPLMRRAVLLAADQRDYMSLVTAGDEGAYRICRSLFPCGTPYGGLLPAGESGTLDQARALIRDAGYAGEKVVIIGPTDVPAIAPFGQVTFSLLRRLGLNVELLETDWGTVLHRRTNRSPVAQGGWSIFHTVNTGASMMDPVRNSAIRGLGDRGMAGWYASRQMEALVSAFIDAPDTDARRERARAVQELATEDVPTVPLGQFFIHTAYRRSLLGIVPSPTPVPWGIRHA